MAGAAPVCLLCRYVLMHLLNRFLTAFVCDKPEREDHAPGGAIRPRLATGSSPADRLA